MRYLTAADAKQHLEALLEAVQCEPIVIRRHKRNVAVIVSVEDYDRLHSFNIAEFDRFCDHVGTKATARGLTTRKIQQILSD